MSNYIGIHKVSLPCSIYGFTVRSDADSFDIFINENMSETAQKRAYKHEMEHIERNDFDMIYSVGELERMREKKD